MGCFGLVRSSALQNTPYFHSGIHLIGLKTPETKWEMISGTPCSTLYRQVQNFVGEDCQWWVPPTIQERDFIHIIHFIISFQKYKLFLIPLKITQLQGVPQNMSDFVFLHFSQQSSNKKQNLMVPSNSLLNSVHKNIKKLIPSRKNNQVMRIFPRDIKTPQNT